MSNIKVCVKLRPLSQQDKKIEKAEEWKVIDNKSLECLNILHPCDFKFGNTNFTLAACKNQIQTFLVLYSKTDHIFGTKSINYEVYMSFVKPIVDRCLNGYDGTVIAYGPTSAGELGFSFIVGTNQSIIWLQDDLMRNRFQVKIIHCSGLTWILVSY